MFMAPFAHFRGGAKRTPAQDMTKRLSAPAFYLDVEEGTRSLLRADLIPAYVGSCQTIETIFLRHWRKRERARLGTIA